MWSLAHHLVLSVTNFNTESKEAQLTVIQMGYDNTLQSLSHLNLPISAPSLFRRLQVNSLAVRSINFVVFVTQGFVSAQLDLVLSHLSGFWTHLSAKTTSSFPLPRSRDEVGSYDG